MRLLVERIDLHATPRKLQRALIGQAIAQFGQKCDVLLPETLTLTRTPLLKPEARRQIQSLGEFTAEQRLAFDEKLGRRIRGCGEPVQIDERAVALQLDVFAAGDE